MTQHPFIKSIRWEVEPDIPMRLFDPIGERDICGSILSHTVIAAVLDADSFTPSFMLRYCKKFSPREVWKRYVRAVNSRTVRRYHSISAGFNMREFLASIPELRQDKSANTSESEQGNA